MQNRSTNRNNILQSSILENADLEALKVEGNLRIPVMTQNQRNGLINATGGDLIFNSTVLKFQGYDNADWINLTTPAHNLLGGLQGSTYHVTQAQYNSLVASNLAFLESMNQHVATGSNVQFTEVRVDKQNIATIDDPVIFGVYANNSPVARVYKGHTIFSDAMFVYGNVTAPNFIADNGDLNTLVTDVAAITYDQSLNTSDQVEFKKISITAPDVPNPLLIEINNFESQPAFYVYENYVRSPDFVAFDGSRLSLVKGVSDQNALDINALETQVNAIPLYDQSLNMADNVTFNSIATDGFVYKDDYRITVVSLEADLNDNKYIRLCPRVADGRFQGRFVMGRTGSGNSVCVTGEICINYHSTLDTAGVLNYTSTNDNVVLSISQTTNFAYLRIEAAGLASLIPRYITFYGESGSYVPVYDTSTTLSLTAITNNGTSIFNGNIDCNNITVSNGLDGNGSIYLTHSTGSIFDAGQTLRFKRDAPGTGATLFMLITDDTDSVVLNVTGEKTIANDFETAGGKLLSQATTANQTLDTTSDVTFNKVAFASGAGDNILGNVSGLRININDRELLLSTGQATLETAFKIVTNYGGTAVENFTVLTDGSCRNDSGSYTAYSDIRLKMNIEDAKSQIIDIKKLRFVNYELIRHPGIKMIGLIAQEVEEVCPGLVDEDKNGIKCVKYSILHTKAVKALQELAEFTEEYIENHEVQLTDQQDQINVVRDQMMKQHVDQEVLINNLKEENLEQKVMIDDLNSRVVRLEALVNS